MEFQQLESDQTRRQSWASSPRASVLDDEAKGLKKYWIKHEDSRRLIPPV